MAALKSAPPGITALREIQVSTHKDKARLVEMNKLATEALAEKHKATVASSRRWLCGRRRWFKAMDRVECLLRDVYEGPCKWATASLVIFCRLNVCSDPTTADKLTPDRLNSHPEKAKAALHGAGSPDRLRCVSLA